MTTYRPCVCSHPDFAHMRTADADDLTAVTRPCSDCSCVEYRYVGFIVVLDETDRP